MTEAIEHDTPVADLQAANKKDIAIVDPGLAQTPGTEGALEIIVRKNKDRIIPITQDHLATHMIIMTEATVKKGANPSNLINNLSESRFDYNEREQEEL